MAAEVFASKIDTWLGIILIGSALVCFAVGISLIWRGELGSLLGGLFLIAVGTGLPAWVMLSTRYTFEPSQLVVVSGPFKWHVPLDQIHAVTPTTSPMSSPALSLDRLRIDYGRGRAIMVSPRDREGFMRAIEQRKPARRGVPAPAAATAN